MEERRDISVAGQNRRAWFFYDNIYRDKLQKAIEYLGPKWVLLRDKNIHEI